jgi:hypothetical protein
MKKHCKICCKKCDKCDKILLKYNWPIDIIIEGMCEKCSKLCQTCGKHTPVNKSFYKNKKRIYCEKCFRTKFEPNDKNYKYTPLTIKDDRGCLLLRWKKTHEKTNCTICCKEHMKAINLKYNFCKKCRKVNNKSSSNHDLSDINTKYINMMLNGKIISQISEKKKVCLQCYSPIWIKVSNLMEDFKYLCEHCAPQDNTKKYKFDKKKQRWVIYREIKICTGCKKSKWFFNNNTDEHGCKEINKESTCKKCLKNT